jgi:hypothetical protein
MAIFSSKPGLIARPMAHFFPDVVFILYRMFQINTLKVIKGIPEWYRTGWGIFEQE